MSAIDFLNTEIPKEKLKTALDVILAFKKCESAIEWMATPFSCWIKLEQLEEFINHLVNGAELNNDTKKAILYSKQFNNGDA